MKKINLVKKDYIYLSVLLVTIVAFVVALIFTSTARKSATENKTKSYYEQKYESFVIQNANLSKGQIIFVGDSITDLYHLDDYYSDLDLAVYNRGISGDTTQGVINRIDISTLNLLPSKIVLMIGTNDVNGGKSNNYIIDKYTEILNFFSLYLPDTDVICMSVISQNDDLEKYVPQYAEHINQIKELNTSIQNLATTFGYTYLDLFSLTIDENEELSKTYSDDGIHLNDAGFVVWTNLVKPYLQ